MPDVQIRETEDVLINRAMALVRQTCHRILPAADAEDAVQATFLVYWRKRQRLATHPRILAWFQRTAVLVCREHLRAAGRRRRHERQVHDAIDAEHGVSVSDALDELEEVMAELPTRYAEVLHRVYFLDESRSEVARKLSVPLGTVDTWLHRGRQRVQELLRRRGIAMHAGMVGGLLCVPGVSQAAALPAPTAIGSAATGLAERVLFRATVLQSGSWAMALVFVIVGALTVQSSLGSPVVADIPLTESPERHVTGPHWDFAHDWPGYRGSLRDGHAAGHQLDAVQGPLPIRWRSFAGRGYSSACIVGQQVVLLGHDTGAHRLQVRRLGDGSPIWHYDLPAPDLKHFPGSRSTPLVVGDRVFVQTYQGVVASCALADGRELWVQDLAAAHGHEPSSAWFGLASSPVLVDGKLLVPTMAKSAGLLALDAETGALLWRSACLISYATPLPINQDGKQLILAFSDRGMTALDCQQGAVVWELPWKSRHGVWVSDPLVQDSLLFVAAGERAGSKIYSLRKNRAPKLLRQLPISVPYTSGLATHGLWLVHGGERARNSLHALDADTGALRWALPDSVGQSTISGQRVCTLTHDGRLIISEFSPDACRQVLSQQVLPATSECWAEPVIARGVVLLRNVLGDVACVSLDP